MFTKFQISNFKRIKKYTKKILYEQNDIKITVEDEVNVFPTQVYDLLSSVTWVFMSTLIHTTQGTPGGLQFKLNNIHSRLNTFRNTQHNKLHLILMEEKTSGIIGVVMLNEFQGEIKRISRYFLAIAEAFQGKNLGKLLRKFSAEYTEQIIPNKGYTHTYIEETHHRSKNLQLNAGMKIIGDLQFFSFQYFNKKDVSLKGDFSLIRLGEWKKYMIKLKDYYVNYKFFDGDISLNPTNYYVLRDENEEILIGAFVTKGDMEIVSLPGLFGKFTNYLTIFPSIKAEFKHFKSISISGIYCKEGMEDQLTKFLSKIFFNVNHGNMMTVCLDTRSPLVKHMNMKGFVLVDKLTRAHCFMKGKNLTFSEEEEIKNQLIFPSPLEIS
jgi:hypothetical protein